MWKKPVRVIFRFIDLRSIPVNPLPDFRNIETSFQCMETPDEDKAKKQVRNYAKYSSMAFQMLAAIGLCTWAGVKLDDYFQTKFPVWTLVLLFIGIFGGMYWSVKDLIRKK